MFEVWWRVARSEACRRRRRAHCQAGSIGYPRWVPHFFNQRRTSLDRWPSWDKPGRAAVVVELPVVAAEAVVGVVRAEAAVRLVVGARRVGGARRVVAVEKAAAVVAVEKAAAVVVHQPVAVAKVPAALLADAASVAVTSPIIPTPTIR